MTMYIVHAQYKNVYVRMQYLLYVCSIKVYTCTVHVRIVALFMCICTEFVCIYVMMMIVVYNKFKYVQYMNLNRDYLG